ncbi:MAG TPA: 3-dehydroquinate synthase [Chloroflexota bacterium]|nr:3-dehydroquinate synthase [Chloroflexota bacterium]
MPTGLVQPATSEGELSSHDLPPLYQRFEVAFRYQVSFTRHLFADDNPLFKHTLNSSGPGRPSRFLCIVEQGVAAHHPALLASIRAYADRHAGSISLVGAPVVVPGGEDAKNDPSLVSAVHRAIHRARIDRHSYVVAVGGGALLDMIGFAAATAHRGVRLVRVPTTVLAQADSGVGVKNGINAFDKKNFLGTFAPPVAVLNDEQFLTTLSDREWRSGIAEAVKVALLKDADFFREIEENVEQLVGRDLQVMVRLIYRCAQLHLDHIARSGDAFESGSSRPLDMGHWAAHKLEQLSGYRLLHGEAVAIGLALDATYAQRSGLLPAETRDRIVRLLSAAGLPTYASELGEFLHQRSHPRCVLHGLTEFREHLGGELTIMLPATIGRGTEVHHVDEDLMSACIRSLEQEEHQW